MGFLVVVLGLVAVFVYRAATFRPTRNLGWGSDDKWVVWSHAPGWAWAAWAIVALGILMLPVLRRTTAIVPAAPTSKMSSRRWAFDLGVSAVVLAAILLVANVHLETFNLPGPRLRQVLVAKQLIPKGTPGTLIARKGMYQPATLPEKEVEADAILDPRYLKGRAAVVEIFPGQQLIGRDFTANDFPPADPVQVTSLTVSATGKGTVSAGGLSVTCVPPSGRPSGRCSKGVSGVPSGLLWLEASPAPGWKFTSWDGLGCRPKTSPACSVRVTLLSTRFAATFAPARP